MRGIFNPKFRDPKSAIGKPLTVTLSPGYRGEGTIAEVGRPYVTAGAAVAGSSAGSTSIWAPDMTHRHVGRMPRSAQTPGLSVSHTAAAPRARAERTALISGGMISG